MTCTFTNTPILGKLKITKAFDSSVPADVTGSFGGNYVCKIGDTTVATGTWTRSGTGDATLTATTGPAADKLPIGVECSATETVPAVGSSSGLPDSSWAWDTPSISANVTVVQDQSKTITVTNKAKRLTGTLAITKAYDTSVPAGTSTTFSGTYICSISGTPVATGTWTREGTGAATLTANSGMPAPNSIPVGAQCSVAETSPAVGTSTGLPDASWVWQTPAISANVTITQGDTKTVTVTNKAKQQLGAVTWTKSADNADKTLLAGSTWQLSGPGVPANTIVTDCIASPCVAGMYKDQDPAAGKFALSGIPFGEYTLTEATAPAGYVVDTTVHTFKIESVTALSLGNFANKQQTPLAIPLTGGLSSDWMRIAGISLAALAAAGAGGMLWRNRRA